MAHGYAHCMKLKRLRRLRCRLTGHVPRVSVYDAERAFVEITDCNRCGHLLGATSSQQQHPVRR